MLSVSACRTQQFWDFFRCIWQITAPNYTAVFIFRFQYNVSLGDVPFQLRLKDLNRAGTNSARTPRVHGQIGLDKAMMMIFLCFNYFIGNENLIKKIK